MLILPWNKSLHVQLTARFLHMFLVVEPLFLSFFFLAHLLPFQAVFFPKPISYSLLVPGFRHNRTAFGFFWFFSSLPGGYFPPSPLSPVMVSLYGDFYSMLGLYSFFFLLAFYFLDVRPVTPCSLSPLPQVYDPPFTCRWVAFGF